MKTSLDWQQKRSELLQKINRAGPNANKDLVKILNNIDPLVTELGKIEVRLRSSRTGFRQHEEQLSRILDRINELEQLITYASLL